MKHIPNIITMMNLILGMAAVLLTYEGSFSSAAILVLIGMVCDGLDGRLARLLHAESLFGKELDSLSDVITFGVAPAFIMYAAVLRNFGTIGVIVAIAFPVAGAFRLARFNLDTVARSYFEGLPITAAGGILAAFTLYYGLIPMVLMPYLTALLAILMVSRTHYPNFKRVRLARSNMYMLPLIVLFVLILFIVNRDFVPPLLFFLLAMYGIYGVWYESRAYFHRRDKRQKELQRQRREY